MRVSRGFSGNAEWFSTVDQENTAIGIWLKQYNHIRPHQALNMRPPVPETHCAAVDR